MRRTTWVGVCAWVLVAGVAMPVAAQLRTQVVAEGLSQPVAFVPDPTSATRFFIVQQGGLIRMLENGVLTTFLDVRPPVIRTGGEEGLLGMAFAPDAATSGRFYVNFTSPDGDIVVARFTRTPANAPTADPASRFDLIWPGGVPHIAHPGNTNHNGGHLAFGPDGYLYVGTGDGGGGNDPDHNAQDPQSLLGKMLRIDVDVPDGHPTGYQIPPDNPYLDGQPIAALAEIWAFGLRNPWRYSFDDLGPGATGALIIGDVGQGAREEVNYEPAGAGGRNYGWRLREGTIATPGVPTSPPAAYVPLANPLFDYERTIGRAVTGGYVYRGTQLPAAYRGRYFVADSMTSAFGSVGLGGDPATGEATVTDVIEHTAELGGPLGGIVSFGRDRDGELYLATFAGRILKIVAAGAPDAPTALHASVSARDVTLAWTPPVTGAAPTSYRLEAGSSRGASDLAVFTTGPSPSVSVAGVPDGSYFVRVRGMANGATGAPSNEVEVVVACAPPAPAGLTPSVTGDTVTLSWLPATGATGYVVEAGSSSGLADLATLAVSTSGLDVSSVPPGTYYVRVRATNACGVGAPSAEVVVSVP
ncbi:MAG: PQQ-dependent sugar dehydrogenase [Acidobacteria bacterium]|nr:PQQ-dependent sugar dehydrogenase [Acidobacteriota bacterium]